MKTNNKLILIFIISLIFSLNFLLAQSVPINSRVFPSARWAWYIVYSVGQDWKDDNGNIIMTRDEIDRWTAAHTDWFIDGWPTDSQLRVNPGLRGTHYLEWFYIKIPPFSHQHTQMWKRKIDGRWIDGLAIRIENYYTSRNMDPETHFF
ncbi:MAG: hypothetical protein NZ822_03015, partial [Patescibacteria group bacterium]|nr:hypothetical protein [Patescibacteria group bacterium]